MVGIFSGLKRKKNPSTELWLLLLNVLPRNEFNLMLPFFGSSQFNRIVSIFWYALIFAYFRAYFIYQSKKKVSVRTCIWRNERKYRLLLLLTFSMSMNMNILTQMYTWWSLMCTKLLYWWTNATQHNRNEWTKRKKGDASAHSAQICVVRWTFDFITFVHFAVICHLLVMNALCSFVMLY